MTQFKLCALPRPSMYGRIGSDGPRGPENPLHMGGHGFGVLHKKAPEIAAATREQQVRTENTQWGNYLKLVDDVKQLFRQVFQIPDTHEIAFDSNTTAFHDKLFRSLLKPEDTVLGIDVEFHALHRTLTALKHRGDIKDISVFEYKDGKDFTKRLAEEIQQTDAKVLSLSHVPSNRQTFFDLQPVLDEAEAKGIHVILDLTQSIGNVLFDMSKVMRPNVTCLFTGIKYLHCGENLGVCVFKKDLPNTSGSTGWFANPAALPHAASTQVVPQYAEGLQFGGGTPGNIQALSLALATLNQFTKPGYTPQEQHTQILQQQDQVLDDLDRTPDALLTRQSLHNKRAGKSNERSNTLVFDLKDSPCSADDISAYLASKGVIVDVRERQLIRMGFQPNLEDEEITFLTTTLANTTAESVAAFKASQEVKETEPAPRPRSEFTNTLLAIAEL